MKKEVYVTLLIGVGWTVGHFMAVHIYERLCVPLTPMGLFMSPFVLDTPHCSALRWVIQHGVYCIRECWKILATVCIATSVSALEIRTNQETK